MELEPYSAPGVPQPYAEPPEWPGWDGRQQNKDEFTTIVTEVPGVAAPWQDTRDGLPWWFPRRAPDIAGKLIYVQEQRVYHRIWDIGEGLARLLGDAVWSLAGGGGGAGGHQQHPWGGHGDTVVTILRVRIDDGTQRDARIRGHLTGANLTLGDRIELWGWKRRGVLMVRKGYNRTSRSVVSSSAMRSPLPVLVLLLLLAAGFCLWLYSNHIPLWPR